MILKCSRASYAQILSLNLPSYLSPPTPLILTSSSLTRLQLIQIPPAYLHVSLVLIQALGEAPRVRLAAPRSAPAVALVWPVLGLRGGGLGLLGFCWSRGATAEEAADGMADGGADCYSTVWVLLASFHLLWTLKKL